MSSENYEANGYGHDLDLLTLIVCFMFYMEVAVERKVSI